jgi:hypothetical protein
MLRDEFPRRPYGSLARRGILKQSARRSRKRLRIGDFNGSASLDEEPRDLL